MKKVFIVIVVISAIALLYAMRDNSPINKTNKPTVSENDNFQPDPSNATFIIDDESITLSRGQTEREVVPGSALTEEIVLMDKLAYGDMNSDGKKDTALLLARYGGGSGTFIYVAAFISGPVTYRGSEAIFIGDRIELESISIDGGIVTVRYLDRKPDDAFAVEPTIPMSKQFVYKNGKFVEK